MNIFFMVISSMHKTRNQAILLCSGHYWRIIGPNQCLWQKAWMKCGKLVKDKSGLDIAGFLRNLFK